MIKFLAIFAVFALSFSFMVDAADSSSATLYYSQTCGHCQKVLSYLHQVNKSLHMKDIKVGSNSQELHELGQRGVPVLVVEGRVIVGADEIIGYMRNHPEILR